jgi:hypothetical protein
MNKVYYLCEFEYGSTGQFYQEVENGTVTRLINLDSSDLTIEEPYGYFLVSSEPIINPFA